MRIIVTGATGFIGSALCRRLHKQGHQVVALSRDGSAARSRVGDAAEVIEWSSPAWRGLLDGTDGVVNLAGESIAAGRWTAARKDAIRRSRVETVAALVAAMQRASQPPRVLVSASAVGYYGSHGDQPLDETASPGRDFLATVCQAWEAEAERANVLGTRVVRLRLGVVLGEGGGALERMLAPFKWYVGGPLGDGNQWLSWIHRDDVIGLIQFAIDHPTLHGPLNATAPDPQPMRVFCRTLGRILRRPSWAPVPAFVLRFALGEMADMLLTGQRVLPAAAQRAGYVFRYPQLDAALRAILL
jgi:uncharacterized protein (TIGR01777 family)